MQPLTKEQQFLEHQIEKMVMEQRKTNELLEKLIQKGEMQDAIGRGSRRKTGTGNK